VDTKASTTRSDVASGPAADRRREVIAFLALAVLIWPFIAVGVVAGWGFVVWISQLLFFGPPDGH
jgi:nitrate reductase NapE